MLTVFELERQLKGPTKSNMHLARSGGTAEAGGGEGVGWTDRWQGQLIMWKWHLADRPRGQGEGVTIVSQYAHDIRKEQTIWEFIKDLERHLDIMNITETKLKSLTENQTLLWF
jgi:hypothetical protein